MPAPTIASFFCWLRRRRAVWICAQGSAMSPFPPMPPRLGLACFARAWLFSCASPLEPFRRPIPTVSRRWPTLPTDCSLTVRSGRRGKPACLLARAGFRASHRSQAQSHFLAHHAPAGGSACPRCRPQ
ncbi:hypothetical protein BDY21DRAFT_86762 [Lineolata rhizophorae]|uniref:Uncharacterized protein n=1 Tax=Lineolata rhizophorae TaxID=578093 RepID=A0A6A6PDG2_9PEZI|nr:hypothetical protein BDY21DRAFT_86762 [Lineolata rhizophorae]